MAISKALRFEVLRRDDFACRYCGAKSPDVNLHIDHVIPVALGGADAPENLVTACAACNAGKGKTSPDAPLVADVEASAMKWGEAMRVAAEKRAAEVASDNNRHAAIEREFNEVWSTWSYGDDHEIPRPDDWMRSVVGFQNAGLPWELIIDSVTVAMKSDTRVSEVWRYFCGVAWRRVREIQESAARSLDGGD